VTPCSVVVGYQRFRGPCRLHLHGGENAIQEVWNSEEFVSNHSTERQNPEDLDLKHQNSHLACFQQVTVRDSGQEPVLLTEVRGCIQKSPDWLPGERTAKGTALCH
jgi:hypothetical protein